MILTVYCIPVVLNKLIYGSAAQFRDRFINLLITTMWVIYPDLVKQLSNAMTCITLKDGSTRLFKDLDIVCWETEHDKTVKYIGIPVIIFYVVGIPLFFIYCLRKYKDLI